jgi:hypothetical protein
MQLYSYEDASINIDDVGEAPLTILHLKPGSNLVGYFEGLS